MKSTLCRLVCCSPLAWQICPAQDKPPSTEPKLVSVFPAVAQRGTAVTVEIRGNHLDGCHSLWTEAAGARGRVLRVEPAGQKPPAVFRAVVEVNIEESAGSAIPLRLVCPGGLTNAVSLDLHREAPLAERDEPHATPARAQPVPARGLISGRLAKPGEVDLYRFDAEAGQSFSFEVSRADNFESRLALYREGGSWFHPDRPVRVVSDEERSDLIPLRARASFRADQPGRYLLEVSSLFGKGSEDAVYVLSAASEPTIVDHPDWIERSFARRLDAKWMAALEGRSGAAATTLTETNDASGQENEISLPALISGSIQDPGEVDSFRIRVEAGQKVTFEIETPQVSPPHFNPRLSVLDGKGRQLFSNVHRRVSLLNNNAEQEVYLRGVEPKAVHVFPEAGVYVLQIRDITSRYGGPGYAYRILVRAQMPHVGEISSASWDRLNLTRGKSAKLILTAQLEEGFGGDVAFSLTGLPAGVTALPTAQVTRSERAPTDIGDNPETVTPGSVDSTILLMADAAAGSGVSLAALHARPVVDGVPGKEIFVRRIPILVVAEAR